MLSEVRNMLHLFSRGQAGKRIARSGTECWLARAFLAPGGRCPVHRRHAVRSVFVQQQRTEVRIAYPCRVLQHCLEYGLQLPGRSGDDAQYFRCRRLLLQRLAQFTRACLYILEQPHILDGDHRLVGESGGELDLPVGEGAHLESRQYDHANWHALPQQRDAEHRVSPPNSPLLGETRIDKIGIGLHIGNMDDFALLRGAPKYRPAAPLHRTVTHILVVLGRISVARHVRIDIATRAMDRRTVGLAQPCRRLHQSVEHRLQIEGRAADHFEYVSCGRLLLQRLAQLTEKARVLDGYHGLSGEVRDQFNLFIGKWSHLLAVNIDRTDYHVLLEHGHGECGPNATEFDGVDCRLMTFRIRSRRCEIVDLGSLFGPNDLAERAVWGRMECTASAHRGKRRRYIVRRGDPKSVSFAEVEDAEFRLAEPRRVRQHRLEYWLQFARRA